MTQHQIIKKYLESLGGTWIKAYHLRGLSTPFGFSGHQADRRARELAERGEIDHRVSGKYAEYRAKPSMKVQSFVNSMPPARAIESENKVQVGSLFTN